jgi:hypothetical protein
MYNVVCKIVKYSTKLEIKNLTTTILPKYWDDLACSSYNFPYFITIPPSSLSEITVEGTGIYLVDSSQEKG